MEDLGAPIAYLALEPGVPVFDALGKEIGRLEHVLADAEEDIFDGLVIDASALPGGLRFADADQIASLHERGVVLSVDADALHEPSENPAAMRADPDDVVDRPLDSRLRRAWDWISGNY